MPQEFTLQTVTNVINGKTLFFASVPRDLQLGATVSGFGIPIQTFVAAFTENTVTINNIVSVALNTTIRFTYNSGSVLKVSSDYKIKVPSSGTIRLDTGINVGQVFITGNLNVQGTTTTVNTENLEIEDNIILLNKGETGFGVSAGTSGIEIARGTKPDGNGQLLWDESIQWYDPWVDQPRDGAWVFRTKLTGQINGIKTNSINTDGNDLALISEGTGIITVRGTTNYERQVLNYNGALEVIQDDTIPNIKAVADKINYTIINDPSDKIKRDNTQVIVYDNNITARISTFTSETANIIRLDHPLLTNRELNLTVGGFVTISGSGILNLDGTWQITFAETTGQFCRIFVSNPVVAPSLLNVATSILVNNVRSNAKVEIDGTLVTEFQQTAVDIFNVRIQDTTITTTVSDTDLILTSPGSGSVQVQDSLKILYVGYNNSMEPAYEPDCVKIYTDVEGAGNTGIYFVSPIYVPALNDARRDELISKKKAIAFAILM